MLNWALMKQPLNWVIVFLMFFIGMMAFNLLLTPWHVSSTGNLSPNSTPGPDLATTQ